MAKRIDISGLSAYYGAFLAVEDINLTIEPRTITAFIGPSGCGKSTVLRSLNRMHEVIPGARTEGKVMLDDDDIYGPGVDPVTVRRTIGMVFQRPNPFPTMSIYDNVIAGLRLNGTKDKATLDAAVEASLKGANLWKEVADRLDKPGAGLSGGQQQRLCIARAIAVKPQVLLMDEPCSALDPISTLAIEDLMGELKEQFTIVIVTHNMQQASRVSDQTAFFTIEGVGQARPAGRGRRHPEDLHQPGAEADRGLHHRPLRLSPAPAPGGGRAYAAPMTRSVSRSTVVAAPPAEVFALLADPRRHAELDGSGTVKGPVSGPDRLSPGARFGMRMHYLAPYVISNEVVEFVAGRADRLAAPGPPRLALRARRDGRGTRVTETFDWAPSRAPRVLELLHVPERNTVSIERTLARLTTLLGAPAPQTSA